MSGQRRWVPALLAAVLALMLPGGGEALPAGGAASVELPEEGGLVALTFDDGPRPATTGRLLDGLALRELPATFFLVGSRLAGDPEGQALVRRMAAEGHQIGVHTFDHGITTPRWAAPRLCWAGSPGRGIIGSGPPMASLTGRRSSGRAVPWSCGRWTRRTGGTGTSTASSPPSPSM